jgi:KaiC/GvpD/RAD55 family RecA-like ATPase
MRQSSGDKVVWVTTHEDLTYVYTQAVVGFLSSMARVLDLVDVQCKVMVAIQPYLRHPVIQVSREVSTRIKHLLK